VALTYHLISALILPDVIFYVAPHKSRAPLWIVIDVGRIIGVCLLFRWIFSVRTSKVAKLSPKCLSRFLTDALLIPNISLFIVGIFFAIDPIKCWAEFDGSREMCKRTLIGQAGLGAMALLSYAISVINSVFPKRIIKKFDISIYQVATGSLNFRERLKCAHLIGSTLSAFYLFAQYNSRAEIDTYGRLGLVAAGCFGSLLITVYGLWEHAVMSKEVVAEEQERQNSQDDDDDDDDDTESDDDEGIDTKPLVLKLHWGFKALGLLSICLFLFLATNMAITMDRHWGSMMNLALPFVAMFYILAFASDPRGIKDGSDTFDRFLFVIFTISEIPATIFEIRRGSGFMAVMNMVRIPIWLVLYYFGIKWRGKIAALSDEKLSEFFTDTMLTNVLQNVTGILYVTFKALNMVIEVQSFTKSKPTIICASFVSVYLLGFVILKMIGGTMTGEQKRANTISWEKIALMTNMGKRHVIWGLLSAITLFCGIFLFCLLGVGEDEADSHQEIITYLVGLLGCGAMAVLVILEIVTLISAKNETDGESERSRASTGVIIVTEFAPFWLNCRWGGTKRERQGVK